MAQLGITSIDRLGPDVIFQDASHAHADAETKTQAALRLAAKT
jgi:L-lactate dehydrogenase (cytochrome)